MRRLLFKIIINSIFGISKALSFIPFIGWIGRELYASALFGRANGFYFRKNYTAAFRAYNAALKYSKELEGKPSFDYSFERAYRALGDMYENGLGVEKDEMKAEEYYLKAGSRGNTAYEHKVATKSWYEKHWK